MKLKGLGRGLDALLAGNESQSKEQQRALPVGNLQPGKYQPRTQMDSASLEELAASIRVQGLMQPILVRPIGDKSGDDVNSEVVRKLKLLEFKDSQREKDSALASFQSANPDMFK